MTESHADVPILNISAGRNLYVQHSAAVADILETFRKRKLCFNLARLDIVLRYRGSLLGPFWLTISTAVMVVGLGFLYATIMKTQTATYLPHLAISLVLWAFIGTVTQEACGCFVQFESVIKSVRLPFGVYAARVVIRNAIVLAHNAIVILVVLFVYDISPGWSGLFAVLAGLLWLVDAFAICLLLGALCARFRDIPPIVMSVMQIAFFVTPVIWEPKAIAPGGWWLVFNPFYSLLEVMRSPLLGTPPSATIWAAALSFSAIILMMAWFVFVRVRGRIAFWV